MKIYAMWVPIMAQMAKKAEIENDEEILFFFPELAKGKKTFAYCARVEVSLSISVLADIKCECGKNYFLTASSQKPLKKGDYIIAWHPEMGKDSFKNFARLSIAACEKNNPDKIFEAFEAKVKFNNFTISGGCDCREMSSIEKLLGGKTRL